MRPARRSPGPLGRGYRAADDGQSQPSWANRPRRSLTARISVTLPRSREPSRCHGSRELLGKAVEGRAGFVGLAMDDLVVVDDVRSDVIPQVADPVLVHGLEQAADGLLICLGSGHMPKSG